jgi:hypothetical protein
MPAPLTNPLPKGTAVIHPLFLWQLARHPHGPVSPSTAGEPPHREHRSLAVWPRLQPATDDGTTPPRPAARPMTAPCNVPNCVGHRDRA